MPFFFPPSFILLLSQVLTGGPPFGKSSDAGVVKKVMDGTRPERPTAGFSDKLWNLLQLGWSEEYENRESKRPSIALILGQLQRDSSSWFSSAKVAFPSVDSKRPSVCKCFVFSRPSVNESQCHLVYREQQTHRQENQQNGDQAYSRRPRTPRSARRSRP